MATLLKGKPVADAISADLKNRSGALREAGTVRTLAVLRVGERPDDLSYEKGIEKRCASTGIEVRKVVLPEDTDTDAYLAALDGLNKDGTVHGILMFRPLPRGIDEKAALRLLDPAKDMDGCTDLSLAGVFAGRDLGSAPCTAEAVTAILDHYGIAIEGKRATVVGRSLVIGRPAAMLLMRRNATVTICHTRTRDLNDEIRRADIVVAATGQPESLGPDCFREGQTVIDVGISWSEEKQKIVGDVQTEAVSGVVDAITPVPGGVGSVTSAILASHVIKAAEKVR